MIASLKQFVRGIQGWIVTQVEKAPDISMREKKSLGKSVEGSVIDFYTFGTGERKILFIGGIHGNEVGTVKLMHYWIDYLAHEGVPDDVTVFVISCLNPDGYVAALSSPDYFGGGKIGKYNANKVDMNRNFDTSNRSSDATMFIANKHYSVSGGSGPESEPEVQALVGLIEQEGIKTAYIYHSRWGTVMGTFSLESDVLTSRYAQYSGYRIFDESDRSHWGDNKKTGHFTQRGVEQNNNIIEIELLTRRGAEWKRNKGAMIDALNR